VGTDLEQLKKLSKMTMEHRAYIGNSARKDKTEQVILSPKAWGGAGTPSMKNLHDRANSDFRLKKSLLTSREESSAILFGAMQNTLGLNSSRFNITKGSKTLFNKNDFV
jgi:hypothetical protein